MKKTLAFAFVFVVGCALGFVAGGRKHKPAPARLPLNAEVLVITPADESGATTSHRLRVVLVHAAGEPAERPPHPLAPPGQVVPVWVFEFGGCRYSAAPASVADQSK